MIVVENMAVRSAEIPVYREEDLHLRPMQLLAEKAVGFRSKLRLSRGKKLADAKSILDVMTLAAEKGPIRLEADGEDADEAVEALVILLNKEVNKV